MGRKTKRPQPGDIRLELERIASSEGFARTDRLKRLLAFLVETALEAPETRASEYLIAASVFTRHPSFDPASDPVVRVETGRLRRKLKEYYETTGLLDPVILDLPARTYTPTFYLRQPDAQPEAPPAPTTAPTPDPEAEETPTPEHEHEPTPAPTVTAHTEMPARFGFRRLLPLVVLIGLGALAVPVVYLFLTQSHATPPEPVRVTFDSGLTGFPAISPNGKLIAYSANRGSRGNLSIWLQTLSTGNAVQLTHGEVDDVEPAFSSDGSEIAFRSERDGGGVFAISAVGRAEPRLIASHGRRPLYSPDGASILFWIRDEEVGTGQLRVVPSQGGAPQTVMSDFADAHHPVWSPNGRYILFCGSRTVQGRSAHDWWVVRASGGEPKKTNAAEVLNQFYRRRGADRRGDLPNPSVWTDRGVVFSARQGDSQSVYRVRLAEGEAQLGSSLVRLTIGGRYDVQPAAAAGKIMFSEAALSYNVQSVPAVAAEDPAQTHLMARVTSNLFDSQPSISADGRWLAFTSERHESRELRLKDLSTDRETLLAGGFPNGGFPIVSPDGSRVVYRVAEGSKDALFVIPSQGGEAQRVCEDCGRPLHWSPDQRYILFRSDRAGQLDSGLMALDLQSGQRIVVAAEAGEGIYSATFSNDGTWIAFHTRKVGKPPQLFTSRFRPSSPQSRQAWIPLGSGYTPVWSSDASRLYFLSDRDGYRCIWSQQRAPGSGQAMGEPAAVRHFHNATSSLRLRVGGGPARVGLCSAAGKLFFVLEQSTGNVWMLEDPTSR